MTLENKTFAVTGANGNLGRAVVNRALAQGANLVLLDIAFSTDLYELPADRTTLRELNMFDEQATRDCFQQLGPIDILCNAAGGFAMGTPVHETTGEDWTRMFDINVRTLLNGVRAVVPGMITRGSGKIINIGANGALTGGALLAPYIAAKSAVMRITESMAAELKDQGINVNCVMPSIIDTPPNREAMPDANYAEWVTPEQLADVICFLATDAASGVHGALVPVTNRA
jgi:NAD(P)-dependent dehydrogenase (short-subunit alcohol dehydrogenase family)